MDTFEIKRSTLPYIHQYSVVYTPTGEVLGQYPSEQQAMKAIADFRQYGIKELDNPAKYALSGNVIFFKKRQVKPNGDRVPTPPQKGVRQIRIDP